MLYLSGSSFSSFHVWPNMSQHPQPLSRTFLIPKLLFLNIVCGTEALKDMKVSPRWRTIFDYAGVDTDWPVRISCLLRRLLTTLWKEVQICPDHWHVFISGQSPYRHRQNMNFLIDHLPFEGEHVTPLPSHRNKQHFCCPVVTWAGRGCGASARACGAVCAGQHTGRTPLWRVKLPLGP